jgi:hypothetical protein
MLPHNSVRSLAFVAIPLLEEDTRSTFEEDTHLEIWGK